MKELWDRSLKPEHFIGGFKASGLFPLNLDAISKVNFATSIPFANSTAPSASTVKTTQYITDLQCTDCGRDMTPVKLHVVAYFSRHLQAQQKPRSTENRRVKPTVYGEVLTSDEVIERLDRQEEEKKEKEAERKQKAAEKKQKAAEKKQKAAEKKQKAAEKKQKAAEKKQKAAEKKELRATEGKAKGKKDLVEDETEEEEISM